MQIEKLFAELRCSQRAFLTTQRVSERKKTLFTEYFICRSVCLHMHTHLPFYYILSTQRKGEKKFLFLLSAWLNKYEVCLCTHTHTHIKQSKIMHTTRLTSRAQRKLSVSELMFWVEQLGASDIHNGLLCMPVAAHQRRIVRFFSISIGFALIL